MVDMDARSRITDAYLSLAEKMPHEDITITALCRTAGVARTTFYYHYGSVREVLDGIEDGFFAEYDELMHERRMYQRAYDEGDLAAVQELLLRNKRLLRTIFLDNPDQRFVSLWERHIRTSLRGYLGANEIRLDILSACFLSLYRYWLTNDRDLSTPEITQANRWLLKLVRDKVF